ncbi:hypothetical protein BDR05DRAFT_966489, partial [Suillus weaverae]
RDDVPRVLWLSGLAGTGKLAIAHTFTSSDETSVSGCSPEHKCAQDVDSSLLIKPSEAGSSGVVL